MHKEQKCVYTCLHLDWKCPELKILILKLKRQNWMNENKITNSNLPFQNTKVKENGPIFQRKKRKNVYPPRNKIDFSINILYQPKCQ